MNSFLFAIASGIFASAAFSVIGASGVSLERGDGYQARVSSAIGVGLLLLALAFAWALGRAS